ncbi:MAG TPA: ATP-binding protein [Candidatus Limnocylindrales bacterium]
MHQVLRDRLALAIAAVAVILSAGTLLFGRYEPGMTLFASEGMLHVQDVARFSQAERDGIRPGMVVLSLNGIQLIRLPEPVYGEFNPDNPDEEPPILRVEPTEPTPVGLSDDDLWRLSAAEIESLDVIDPIGLQEGSVETGWYTMSAWYPQQWSWLGNSSFALLPGLGILLVGTWWIGSGRSGESLRTLAVPLAAGTAIPFLVEPLASTGAPLAVGLAGIIATVGVVPLGLALASRIPDASERQFVQLGVGVLAAAAAVASVLFVVAGQDRSTPEFLRWALIGSIALAPGLAAAGPIGLGGFRAAGGTPRNLLQSTELAVAGATPLFALATTEFPYLFPIGLWLAAVALAGRFTVRPLARLVTRAQLQRDLVVAATEAERARLAADIHDDALQELTLLVRRLEAAGDEEGAEIGRTVAERLRAICGDLRLPILDDLGVGPALDWLVLRIERLAGGEVRLERTDGARHNPDVELAVFRVAQEALANAIKHGSPPIVVRYQSTPSGISLSIDDSGPGITPDAGETAEREGHFGLLNMQQRAEQIGAILDVRRWPSGGTHVALEWRQG